MISFEKSINEKMGKQEILKTTPKYSQKYFRIQATQQYLTQNLLL